MAVPKDLRVGDYITDGKRLLRVERLTSIGLDGEDAMVPDKIVSLPRVIVERDWRKVTRSRAKAAT